MEQSHRVGGRATHNRVSVWVSKDVIIGDIEKMIAVGLVWGATNAIMRRGALLWDQALRSSSSSQLTANPKLHQRLMHSIGNWLKLLAIWQYSIPFLINLSASATFFALLGHTPISLAVPVTNATTFAATAVFGMLLGEETHVGTALFVEMPSETAFQQMVLSAVSAEMPFQTAFQL